MSDRERIDRRLLRRLRPADQGAMHSTGAGGAASGQFNAYMSDDGTHPLVNQWFMFDVTGAGFSEITGYTAGHWDYFIPIVVWRESIGAGITSGYPMHMSGAGLPDAFWSGVLANGNDILITESDCTTIVPYDLVHINTAAKTMELHCKPATVSSTVDTPLVLFYGNSAATGMTAAQKQSVWSTYFQVLHMGEASGNYAESSGSGTAGVDNGTTHAQAGKLYSTGAALFDGTNDYVNLTGLTNASKSYTFSWWYKSVQAAHATVNRGMFDSLTGRLFLGMLRAATGLQFAFEGTYRLFTAPPNDGNWHHQQLSLNNATTTGVLYTDGATPQNITYVGQAIGGSTVIGCNSAMAANSFFAMTLDEFRITTAVQSAARAATEYKNQNSPSTFYGIGPVQQVGDTVTGGRLG